MSDSQLLLSRFLQSGNAVAVGGEIRDNIVIERLEDQAQETTPTLLEQFLNELDNNSEVPSFEIMMPIFLLQNLLQTTLVFFCFCYRRFSQRLNQLFCLEEHYAKP